MIRRILPYLTLLTLVLGIWIAPNSSYAQSPTTQDVCLARWEWKSDDGGESSYWGWPFQANALGRLDLRSPAETALPGPRLGGWGLFSYDQPMGSTGMACYGADLDAGLRDTQVDTIALVIGLKMGDIQSRTMRSLIREVYTEEADPTGVIRWKPIRINRKNGFQVRLQGFGTILNEKFSESHSSFQPTLDVRWADYRRHKLQGTDRATLQRWNDYDSFNYFGRKPDAAILDKLIPPEHRLDGSLPHRSIFGDTFVEVTSDTALTSHTPTGPNAGTGWASEAATGTVQALNDLVLNDGGGTSLHRMTDNLSSDDHYGEIFGQDFIGGSWTSRWWGAAARVATGATTAYIGGWDNSNARIYYLAAGVYNLVATVAQTNDGANHTHRLEVSGSDLELFIDTVSVLTGSDGNLTGNLNAGFAGSQTGGNRLGWDDFEEADLAAPAARRIFRIR